MNFLRSLTKTFQCASRLLSTSVVVNHHAILCATPLNLQYAVAKPLLLPQLPVLVPACGLKIKGRMRLRCKDCYYVRREGRLYVMCKTFPRHKQTHLVKREKYTWIFSHAMQSKLRPY